MKTDILVEEGRVGLRAELKKRKYASGPLKTLNHLEAREILLTSGYDIGECMENTSVVISNSGGDNHPFENTWWFPLRVQEKPKTTKTRTRRPRKTKNEQSE